MRNKHCMRARDGKNASRHIITLLSKQQHHDIVEEKFIKFLVKNKMLNNN